MEILRRTGSENQKTLGSAIYVSMNKYYVYLHRNPFTKEPFYVGKGTGNRAFDRKGRTEVWRELVSEIKKEGLLYSVEIIHICDSEQEALALEKIEIGKYSTLVNISNYSPLETCEDVLFYPDDTRDIGAKISELRRSLNIPASTLARTMRMSRVTLQRIESGSKEYGITQLLKVLKKLKMQITIP